MKAKKEKQTKELDKQQVDKAYEQELNLKITLIERYVNAYNKKNIAKNKIKLYYNKEEHDSTIIYLILPTGEEVYVFNISSAQTALIIVSTMYKTDAYIRMQHEKNCKKFYTELYLTDEYGQEINETLTFNQLLLAYKRNDIYSVIPGDSVMRERLENELDRRFNIYKEKEKEQE